MEINEPIINLSSKEDLDILSEKVDLATEELSKIKSKNDIIKENKKNLLNIL